VQVPRCDPRPKAERRHCAPAGKYALGKTKRHEGVGLACRVGKELADIGPAFRNVHRLLQELPSCGCPRVLSRVHYTARQLGTDRVRRIPVLRNGQDFGAVVDSVDVNPVLLMNDVKGFYDFAWRDLTTICGDMKPPIVNDRL